MFMAENLNSEFIYQNHLSFKNKIGRMLWGICWVLLFRPFITPFFQGWRSMILRVFGAKIGKLVTIHSTVKIWAPWNLVMEDNSCLAHHVDCYNVDKVTIKKDATVSQYVFLCTASHDIESKEHELITKPIVVGEHAWIGARAFIGLGVTVGDSAVVGATASVFKDVEPWTVVGGNPAKFIKKRVIKD